MLSGEAPSRSKPLILATGLCLAMLDCLFVSTICQLAGSIGGGCCSVHPFRSLSGVTCSGILCRSLVPNLTHLGWEDSLRPTWKPPSLISFESFEDVLAHYSHRANAKELRGLIALEEFRQTKLNTLHQLRNASDA